MKHSFIYLYVCYHRVNRVCLCLRPTTKDIFTHSIIESQTNMIDTQRHTVINWQKVRNLERLTINLYIKS